MPDPAPVNARIAELVDQHDLWWAVPEAVAEAVKLWGGGSNEHGVFCTHERIEFAKTSHAHAAVLIAESGNGFSPTGWNTEPRWAAGAASPPSGVRRSARVTKHELQR